MDEARRVIERLEQIEQLRRSGAAADALLAEVRGLLEDGERWLSAEGAEGLDDAQAALERCRAGLEDGERGADSSTKGVVVGTAI
ncbi:MAG TPA: hypothetical protein VE693_12130 [Gaiellaceae bacterium]|jgi:hypothetical protein|nr:hypothetical protein [Gaiellaceae bacterium]